MRVCICTCQGIKPPDPGCDLCKGDPNYFSDPIETVEKGAAMTVKLANPVAASGDNEESKIRNTSA